MEGVDSRGFNIRLQRTDARELRNLKYCYADPDVIGLNERKNQVRYLLVLSG